MRILNFILGAFAVVAMASCSLYADIVIQNNFDGVADDTGPAFQLLTNGAQDGGSLASFDATTGVVVVGGNNDSSTTATGFNNGSLAPLAADVESITATFVISDIDNALLSRSNGFFIGLATEAGATDTTGAGLFNNTAAAVGLRFNSNDTSTGPLTAIELLTEPATSGTGATILESGTIPEVASIEDGFTFVLTLNNNDTLDASTEGLSTEISATGLAFSGPSFADFITNGVGVNSTFQGGGGGFTIDSVTVHAATAAEAIPEPSSLALLGLASLGLVTRRRR